jgi:flagellar protein FliO/FliZ
MTSIRTSRSRSGRGTLNLARVAAAVILSACCVSIYAQTPAAPAAGNQTVAAPAVDETTLALQDEGAAAPAVRSPSSAWAIIRTLIALVVVAAAVYGVVYFLRKIGRPAEVRESNLKVLASAHLGSNRFVHVVSLGEKAWLVGASDGGVSLISELEDKESIDALLLEESRRAGEGGVGKIDFRSIMRKFGAQDRATGPRSTSAPSADGVRERRERLRGL